jgi:hypothetical protein
MTVSHARRTRAVEIRLTDVSPRFQDVGGSLLNGFDRYFADQRRAWYGVQAALLQKLKPWLDDGWEILPSSLGPHTLHLAIERTSQPVPRPGFGVRKRGKQRYVRSATVLLQKPVHL